MSTGNVDWKKKNETKSKYYRMFNGKIDKEIIDMVLTTCEYNEDKTYQSLIEMVGEALDVLPPSPGRRELSKPPPGPRPLHNIETIERDSGTPSNSMHQVKPPSNLFEQLSTSPKTDISSLPLLPLAHNSQPNPQHYPVPKPRADINALSIFTGSTSASTNLFQSGAGSPNRQPPGLVQQKSNVFGTHQNPFTQPSPSNYQPTTIKFQDSSSAPPPSLVPSQGSHTGHVDFKTVSKSLSMELLENKASNYYQNPSAHWLILMRGLPGSGKSYKARELSGGKGIILSTDEYFMKNGSYEFDPSKLPDAHKYNQIRAKEATIKKISPIIIDNTNIETWHMKTYVIIGLQEKYQIEIVEPDTEWAWRPSELVRRNQHGVSKSAIQSLKDRYEKNVTVDSIMRTINDVDLRKVLLLPDTNVFEKQQQPHRRPQQHNQQQQQQQHYQQQQQQHHQQQKQQQQHKQHQHQQRPRHPSPTSAPPRIEHQAPPSIEHQAQNEYDDDANIGYVTMDEYRITHNAQKNGDLYFEDKMGYQNVASISKSGSTTLDQKDQTSISRESANDFEYINRNNKPPDDYQDYHYLTQRLQQQHSFSSHRQDSFEEGSATQTNYIPGNDDVANSSVETTEETKELLPISSVKDSSGTTLTAKQLNIRQSLYEAFSHVDKEALDQVLESCSYNFEAASNFVRISCRSPSPPKKDSQKKKEKTSKKTDRKTLLPESDVPSSSSSSKTKKSSTKKNSGIETGNRIENHNEDAKMAMAAGGSNDDKQEFYSGPPRVSRTVNKSGEKDQVVRTVSSGKIGDIVDSYKGTNVSFEPIDISDTSSTATHKISYSEELNVFMEYNLKFLYECFPDYSKQYCQKWLKRYSGDLIKTCDYLSRLSQVDDLPHDVIDIDNDDDDVGDVDYEMIDLTSDVDDTTINDVPSSTLKKKLTPTGELFYIGDDKSVTSNNVAMAIDKNLGMELKKRFGDKNDFDNEELQNDDFIFDLGKDVAKLLYTAWNSSIRAKKRKLDTLDEDEKFAKLLQEEENKAAALDGPDGKGKHKKKKTKTLTIDTKYNKDQPSQLQGEGIFSPQSVWKEKNGNKLTPIEDGTGHRLTTKQLQTREDFYMMFPGVEEESLDQVLEAASYNLDAASKVVSQSTGAEKNTDDKNTTGWKIVMSPPRKKLNDSNTPQASPVVHYEVEDGFQTLTEGNQSYQDLRAEAEIHSNLRRECFKKAAEAYQSKNGQLSQYYADKAKEHTLKMQDAHFRAAEMTLLRTNKAYMKDQKIIDLHGLHSAEAVRALRNFLENAHNIGHTEIEVITGRGNHSKNGYSTVRNAILTYLNQKQYKYKLECSGGSIRIRL